MPERVGIEDHFGLVRAVCRRFREIGALLEDDLFQIGCIGLVKASRTFDAKRGVKFSTFATWCIYGEVSGAVRLERVARGEPPDVVRKPAKGTKKPRRAHVIMQMSALGNDENGEVVDVAVCSDEPACESIDELEIIYLSELSPRRRVIVRRVAMEEANMAALGRRDGGVTREAIRQQYEKGIASLRKIWAHRLESA